MIHSYSDLLNTFVENTLKLPDSTLHALEYELPLPPTPLIEANKVIVNYFRMADTLKLSDEILDALNNDDTY